jgi:T5SS/PEP-CTERM-associated repeat protein
MFNRKMIGLLSFILISVLQAQAARFSEGSVYPDSLSATNGWVDIGYDEAWGRITVNNGSQWYVGNSRFNISNGGEFIVSDFGTLVEVDINQGSLYVVDGSVSVSAAAQLYSSGVTLGSSFGSGHLTLTNATAKMTYGLCSVDHGSALIQGGATLDGSALVYGRTLDRTNNVLTVEGAGAVMTGNLQMFGGTLQVRDGGRILGGGDLYSNPQNDNEPMLTRGYVSGAGSEWGYTNNISHVIGEGGELYVSDGGVIKSAKIDVGENHSSALDQLALLDVTGSGSRVDVHVVPGSAYENGYLKIGYDSPAQVNVRDGAELLVPSLKVYEEGSLQVEGSSVSNRDIQVYGSLLLAEGSTLTNTFLQSYAGSEVTISGNTTVLDVGQLSVQGADWIVDGATLNSRNSVTISDEARIDMSATTWTSASYIVIGTWTAGSLSLSNGATFTGTDVYMGRYGTGQGDISLSGAGTRWTSAGDIKVGYFGSGTFMVSSGAVVQAEDCLLGEEEGSQGNLLLSGSNTLWDCNALTVGIQGPGRVEIRDGATLTAVTPVFAGDDSSAVLTVAGADSEFSSTNRLWIGSSDGSFDVTITNGGSVVTDGVVLQSRVSDMRTALITDENSLWKSTDAFSLWNAHVQVEAGGHLVANRMDISGSSEFELNAGRCDVTNGFEAYGDFSLSNGAVMTSDSAYLSMDEGIAQGLQGAGTIWTNTGDWAIESYAFENSSPFMIEDGAKLRTETAVIGSQWGFGDLTVDGADSVLQVVGELNVGWDLQEEGYYDESEGSTSTHHLTLNGSQVSGGTIAIRKSGEILGSGRIYGATTNGGTLSPGTEAQCGKLHFTDAYVQSANGVLSVDLRGTSDSGEYDEMYAAGTVELAGTLRVTVGDWIPMGTNDFQIISSKGSISGTFSQVEVSGVAADAVEYLGNGVVRVIGDSALYNEYLAEYGLSSSDLNAGMDDDYDQDGFSNLDEFIAGTNLKVENEYLLKILDFSASETGSCFFSFDAVAGRNYPVYWSTNLCASEPWVLHQIITNEVTETREITMPDNDDGFRCYRLGVTLP